MATITGTSGNDTLNGTNSDDTIWGLQGNDDIFAGDGHDTIIGGDGNDDIYGNAGNDEIWTDNGIDIVYGGDGNDIIRGLSSINPFPAASGNKTFYGEEGNDTIYGGLGNDTMRGGNGEDTIRSDDGSDVLYGDLGNDSLLTYTKLNQVSTLYGNDGNDSLLSGSANSVLSYQAGISYLYGGTGDDFYRTNTDGTPSAYVNFGNINIYDDAGTDDSFYILNGNLAELNFTVVGNDLVITSDTDLGSITIDEHFTKLHSIEELILGAIGQPNELHLNLIETLTNGNNTYTATTSTSPIGIDNNIIDALDGDDTIYAGAGNDLVYGGNGIDIIYGEAGADSLYGDGGNDQLLGGDDNDTLYGGAGNDVMNGGNGTDTADYKESIYATSIDLQNNTASGGDAAGDTLTSIENVIGSNSSSASERDYIWGNASANSIYGLSGDDILEGGAGADTIDGGAGWDYSRYIRSDAAVNINLQTGVNTGGHAQGDTLIGIEAIVGSAYNDTIRGGSGNDYLKGENGNDLVTGGLGIDQLFGGGGLDTFLFEAASAFAQIDKVQDFSLAQNDIIDISDLLIGYDPLTEAITDFVQITDSGANSILAVDADGGANNFVQIATIYAITGLTNEEALETSGNLITA